MSEQVMVGFVVFLIVWMTLVIVLASALEIRKTKKYRRELGDLYVSSKIRKIASNEDLDLEVEKASFLDWDKKNKVKDVYQNYDDVVEEEMKEKVVEALETKPTKK